MASIIMIVLLVILLLFMAISVLGVIFKEGRDSPIISGCIGIFLVGGLCYVVYFFGSNFLSGNYFKSTTLIDYFDNYLQEREKADVLHSPGYTMDSAFANEDTSLMSGPGDEYSVLSTISKNEEVILLYLLSPVPSEEENSYRNGNWIKARYQGETGWINGNKFRPPNTRDKDTFWKRAISKALIFIFPEDTIFKKIIGFAIGVLIALVVNRISNALEMFEKIRAVVPAAFFALKALTLHSISFLELLLFVWIYIILAALLDLLISSIFNN